MSATNDSALEAASALLAGKVAIVTGASAGIGVGVAQVMHSMGARVVGMARRGLSDAADESGPDGFPVVRGDLTVLGDPSRVVNAVVAAHGRIDIVVNNAGSMGANPVAAVTDITVEDWDEMMAVNARGPFLMAKAALPHMVAQGGGVIVNVSSFTAVEACAHMAAYNASKAAMLQLSNSIAVEYAANGVRSIGILMGGVTTEMSANVGLGMYRLAHGPDAEYPEGFERAKATMSALDVGKAIAVLCSDLCTTVTGTTVALDGAVSAGALTSMLMHMAGAGALQWVG